MSRKRGRDWEEEEPAAKWRWPPPALASRYAPRDAGPPAAAEMAPVMMAELSEWRHGRVGGRGPRAVWLLDAAVQDRLRLAARTGLQCAAEFLAAMPPGLAADLPHPAELMRFTEPGAWAERAVAESRDQARPVRVLHSVADEIAGAINSTWYRSKDFDLRFDPRTLRLRTELCHLAPALQALTNINYSIPRVWSLTTLCLCAVRRFADREDPDYGLRRELRLLADRYAQRLLH
jgi:hypothetical protein